MPVARVARLAIACAWLWTACSDEARRSPIAPDARLIYPDAATVGACGLVLLPRTYAPPSASRAPFGGVQLTTSGAGSGRATATVSGAPCDAACLAALTPGAILQVTATADPGSWFHGWVAGCSGRHACEIAAADGLSITADFTPEPNRVFVSSVSHDGDFGGIAGGDALCQQLAGAAGLTGTYHIVLGTGGGEATVSWRARAPGARGWIRIDGEPVGDDDFGDCAGLYNVRLDERGNDVGHVGYWAFPLTTFGGGTHCSDWTSNTGGAASSRIANSGFTADVVETKDRNHLTTSRCNERRRFLCAGIDRTVAVIPVATRGRLAFATRGDWNTTTGLAAADGLCASEARAAGAPGSFKALLATVQQPAIARFDTSGPPWVRVDGVPLLPTAAAFASAIYLDVAPGVAVDGALMPSYRSLAFGASAVRDPGTLESTCHDWQPSAGSSSAGGFSPWSTIANSMLGCVSHGVLCLQE